MTTDQSVWIHSPDSAAVVGERVAILSLDDLARPALVLEDTAATIWRAIDGRLSVRQVINLLESDWALEPGSIDDDVVVFMDELHSLGLIEQVLP